MRQQPEEPVFEIKEPDSPLILAAKLTLLGGVAFLVARLIFPPRPYSLRGKVVLITGGSRGLGLALGRRLAREGAKLALLARDLDELEAAATDLANHGTRSVTICPCDIRNEGEVLETVEAVAEREGRLDVIINNAGVILVAPLEKMTDSDFEDAMQTHFWGPYHVTMAALRHLKRNRESRVVNIASIGGRVAVPHLAPYSASKFALVGLSDALRAELSKFGIRVTTVSPGLMRTGSHTGASFKGDHRKEFAWFSLGAALPLVSINADRAADQIVSAMIAGKAELTISLQARFVQIVQAIFPNLTATTMKLVNALLPKSSSVRGLEVYKGVESTSWISPSLATTLGDEASVRFHEPVAKDSH